MDVYENFLLDSLRLYAKLFFAETSIGVGVLFCCDVWRAGGEVALRHWGAMPVDG